MCTYVGSIHVPRVGLLVKQVITINWVVPTFATKPSFNTCLPDT